MSFNFDDYIFSNAEDDVEFLPLLSVDDETENSKVDLNDVLPILPLRNTVLFPGVVIPITVGRDKSIKAVKSSYDGDRIIGVVSQKDHTIEDPELKDLNRVGTAARIVKMLKMPDGSTTVIMQGKKRIRVDEYVEEEPFLKGAITPLPEVKEPDDELNAMVSSMKDYAQSIVKLSPNIPSEAGAVLKNIESSDFLIHFIASNLNISLDDKQQILETDDMKERANLVLGFLSKELHMLELKSQIQSKVKDDIEKQQRDYFLNQQLKTIQEELGGGDTTEQEVERLKKKAEGKKWSEKVARTFNRELEKLQRINPAAAEYSVILNYLDTLLELPFEVYTEDNFDLKQAKEVLDADHYGLEKIKERILEYLAVLKLKGDMKSPILCFVGPPGVGKTSLGRSIGRAIGRKYVRMSLGGLHDEAQIRWHRKTYIGAMSRRIMQSLKKVQSSNPVFILDEVDKVGHDFRGDPSSALLEVLDPEQNSNFYDNYLELEYDLSKVLFIATANNMNTIQPALRDRMEIIHLEGYSVEEKIEIAKRHLVPKQREAHGLKSNDIRLPKKTLEAIITDYTRESGVRELERQIGSVMRNIAKRIATGQEYKKSVSAAMLAEILGPKKYDREEYLEENPSGVAIGLAYTSTGGDILYIESILSKGKGNLTLTGQLGDVMKESASTALSFLKSHSDGLDIDDRIFQFWNIHLHVPEGGHT
jgi:ATP-dependent Lon protease